MEDDSTYTPKDQLFVFASIPLGESPEMVAYIKEPRDIRVLLVVENPPRSFSQPFHWDGELVAFPRNVVEGILPPTVQINP